MEEGIGLAHVISTSESTRLVVEVFESARLEVVEKVDADDDEDEDRDEEDAVEEDEDEEAEKEDEDPGVMDSLGLDARDGKRMSSRELCREWVG